ncbi:Ig-like domain-containing protein [Rhodococcus sp. NPDC058505]|uniref:Ig-like domain-containing protein n=1 Tax=unclassified Rhodococcus (in: high G+C Gram-positive bacteria) TaxID=192944 RepID=UPI00364A1CAD
MTSTITTQGGVVRRATVLGSAVVALLLAACAAVLMPPSAHADPNYLTYSADNAAWGGMDQIPALSGELIPGGEATSQFWARNDGTEGGRLQVYLGNWTKSQNMQAYVRAEINDAAGATVELVNDVALPGTELSSIHLNPGESAKVLLVVGMPAGAGNETQDGTVDPAFSLDFELDPAAVASTTAVTAVAATIAGTSVELTATVTPAEATGTVQFKDGGTDIGGPVALATGVATYNHTFTTTGAHEITAVYSGDTGFATSTSPAHVVTVSSAELVPTSITISGGTAVNNGTNIELIAAVAPNAATGTVQFTDNGVALGAPVALVNGVAKINRSFNVDGDHNIIANYLGDATHAPSTSVPHTVTVSSVTPEPGGTGSAGSMDMGSLGGLLGGS